MFIQYYIIYLIQDHCAFNFCKFTYYILIFAYLCNKLLANLFAFQISHIIIYRIFAQR